MASAFVGLLALLSSSCDSGEGRGPDPRALVPAVFGRLPGNTCVVLADPALFAAGAPDFGRAAGLRALTDDWRGQLESLGLIEVPDAPEGVLAWAAAGRRTGFPDLRTSAGFQDAVAATRDAGDLERGPLVYLDLQLLVDLGLARFAAEMPPMLRGSLDSLGMQALRWAVATVDMGAGESGAGDLSVRGLRGEVRSSMAGQGVTALLAAGPEQPSLLAPSAESGFWAALRFDPTVARGLLDELGSVEDQGPMGSMVGGVAAQMRGMLTGLLEIGDGRLVVNWPGGEDPEVALGVRPGSAAAAALGSFGRELDDGRFVVLGSRFLALDGDRVVTLIEEDAELPARGAEPLPAGRCVDARISGSDGGLQVQVERLSPGRLRFRADLRAPGESPR